MIKNYFKQAWASACHNKVSTCLYLSGVALAVATVMILSIGFHTKLSPIYPENNRDRMAYVQTCWWERENSSGNWGFPWQMLDPIFGNLKNAEAVAIRNESRQTNLIGVEGSDKELKLNAQWVNDGFFQVYTYEFLAGSPITAAEVASASKVAIIDRLTAETMFGSVEDAIGKTITYASTPLTIKGVVREASRLTPMSYANVYIPLTIRDDYNEEGEAGPYRIIILLREKGDMESLRAEISSRFEVWNKTLAKVDDLKYILFDQPRSHYDLTFNPWSSPYYDAGENGIEEYVWIGLVLLLVPALNLSGLISGNIRRRANEIGIRKSFGAARTRLLGELVTENFILTLAGSIIGLGLAWVLVYCFRDWVFTISDSYVAMYSDTSVHFDMLFSPVLFLIALGAALLLNTVSSLVPAWHSLRRPIVESLNQKL